MKTVIAALLLLPAMALASDEAVSRAIDDLKACTEVDQPVCRAVPGRLAAYGDRAVAPIERAFKTLPPAGQILAVVALRQIVAPRATQALVTLAGTPEGVVRTLVLSALGDRHGRAVEKALIQALSAPQPTVRQTAAEALGRLPEKRDNKRVVPALLKSAGDDVLAVARTAMESAALLRDPRVIPVVREALQSPNVVKRKSGLFCLRFVGDDSVYPIVIELLRDDDAVVVQDAARALERMSGREYGPDYYLWKGWWDARQEGNE